LDTQIDIFKKQLILANSKHKFVSIHCVYEWDKLYKAMDALKLENYDNMILLHSFHADSKLVNKFKNFNCWFSISPGCFNEKNYAMLKQIPLENLVLESDAPSMFNPAIYDKTEDYNFYAIKDEKTQNHPLSVLQLGKALAKLYEINLNDFMKIISKNSKKLISKLI
jgi:Tat protein secretion system quality control protein TatD with DNase activity